MRGPSKTSGKGSETNWGKFTASGALIINENKNTKGGKSAHKVNNMEIYQENKGTIQKK